MTKEEKSMMRRMRYSWIVSLLLLLVSGAALADDFNPANPPDPQRPPEPVTPPTLYQVTVSTVCFWWGPI